MPAPTTVIPGLDWTLGDNNTTAFAAGRDLSVSLTTAEIDLTSRDSSNWQRLIAGAREWSAEWSGVFTYGGVSLSGLTGGITIDGTALAGWTSYGINFTSASEDTVDSTTGLDTTRFGTRRALTFSIEGNFYDPKSAPGTALDTLLGARENGAAVAVVVTVATGFTVAASCIVSDVSISSAYEGKVTASISLTAAGLPTVTRTTGSQGAQVERLFAGLLGTTRSTTLANLAFGPPVVVGGTYEDWTFFRGQCMVSALSLEAEYTGNVTISTTLLGTGAIAIEQAT